MDLAVNINQKCRLCGADLQEISHEIFNDKGLLDNIKKYLQITIKKDDCLPKNVCNKCTGVLNDIDDLTNIAEKTEKEFLKYLNLPISKKGSKRNNKNNNTTTTRRSTTRSRKKATKSTKNNTKSNTTITTTTNKLRGVIKIENDLAISSAIKPFRNPRHTDHITLEQIINEQIAKNPKIEKCLHTDPQLSMFPSNEISIYAYDDLKLGQLIKDSELLKLILKALKWDERNSDFQLERLKNTSFRHILSNSNLLQDGDLLQLIKSYVGQDTFSNIHNGVAFNSIYDLQVSYHMPNVTVSSTNKHSTGIGHNCFNEITSLYNGDESVTEMEVKVDPDLFLPYDDDGDDDEVNGQIAEESCDSTTVSVDLSLKKDFEDETDRIDHCSAISMTTITLVEENQFHCSTCPQSFKTHVQLQDHVLTHLLKKKSIEKQKLHKSGKENELMVQNMDGNLTSKYNCLVCDKILSTKGNLKMHMDTHKPKGKYTCDKCGRIFKTVINLLRHKEYHSGIKFSCDICGRVYPTNSTLKAHSITHSNFRPHSCSICLKTFKRNQDLKFHINQHTGAKPYKCPYCPKAFASSGNCFSHRKRMHPSVTTEQNKSEEENIGEN